MSIETERMDIAGALESAGERLHRAGIPEPVMEAALAANPWFTRRYIGLAFEGVLRWLAPGVLSSFAARYPVREGPRLRAGLVMAGNLPFVGLHDLLMVWLAGHRALVKYSRQDRVLMEWIAGELARSHPLLPGLLEPAGEAAAQPDLFIGTGSNNTARYLEARYRGTPRIIRKNRFSAGWIQPGMTEADWAGLAEDILAYNGLGCRNVSNLLLLPGASLDGLRDALGRYDPSALNPYYLERVRTEKVRFFMLKQTVSESPVLLLQQDRTPGYSVMGLCRVIETHSAASAASLLDSHRHLIQCTAGLDVPFGHTQSPEIDDFADGVDTLAFLCGAGSGT
ncbi:MAG: hypothetical protein NW241_01585 [Bacteroidia bacterium]|nr:hypothetical protein [Bacteroidia bacterium]